MIQLPRLYAITDRRLSARSHIDQVRLLISGGVRCIQLREKELSPMAFLEEARACVELARAAEATLIVNDRVDIALASGADGVHLGQSDMPAPSARLLLGERRLVGLSTHNYEQATAADKLPVDYLAVGPIFDTHTKVQASPVVGLEMLRAICQAVQKPVVAIGGITLERAAQVIDSGARCVAVISNLLTARDIAAQAMDFNRRLGA